MTKEGLKQFRPLTDIERVERDPLLISFNDKYSIKYDLWDVVSVARFWEVKDTLSEKLKEIEGEKVTGEQVAIVFSSIAFLLYTLCDVVKKKTKESVSKRQKAKLQSQFMAWSLKHTDVLMDNLFELMNYQTRLFFLLQHHLSFPLIQEAVYSKIGLDPSQITRTYGPKHGLISVVPEKVKRKKP